MLQYHITFAEIISQCSEQYHIIRQNTCIFTIEWFDDNSASLVHRGNAIPPPQKKKYHLQTTRITVICQLFILLFKCQNSYFVLNSSFDIIIYTAKPG